jgi:hypothetical protein
MIRLVDDPALERTRPPATPDPSPDEIAAACLVIQSRWTGSIREERMGCYALRRVEVPVVPVGEVVGVNTY